MIEKVFDGKQPWKKVEFCRFVLNHSISRKDHSFKQLFMNFVDLGRNNCMLTKSDV